MGTSKKTVGLAVAAGVALVAIPGGVAWAVTAADASDAPGAQERARLHDHGWDGDGVPGDGTMRGAWHHHGHHRGAGHHGPAGGDGTGWIETLIPDGAEGTEADAESLARMAEEERMARDLYVEFADAWDLRVFAMIARAESRHMDRVDALLDAYGLDNPNDGAAAGEYQDAEIQALYDELLAQGTASETGALAAAALVEETDIADLRVQAVDSAVIDAVYDRLEHASEHHLTAFVRSLDARGEDYAATVLDPAEVEDITGVPAP